MDQLGHADPTFTFRVYRHGMRRDARSAHALAQLVGVESKRQRKGSKGRSRGQTQTAPSNGAAEKTAR